VSLLVLRRPTCLTTALTNFLTFPGRGWCSSPPFLPPGSTGISFPILPRGLPMFSHPFFAYRRSFLSPLFSCCRYPLSFSLCCFYRGFGASTPVCPREGGFFIADQEGGCRVLKPPGDPCTYPVMPCRIVDATPCVAGRNFRRRIRDYCLRALHQRALFPLLQPDWLPPLYHFDYTLVYEGPRRGKATHGGHRSQQHGPLIPCRSGSSVKKGLKSIFFSLFFLNRTLCPYDDGNFLCFRSVLPFRSVLTSIPVRRSRFRPLFPLANCSMVGELSAHAAGIGRSCFPPFSFFFPACGGFFSAFFPLWTAS